jgi:hypothetical protein
MSMRGHAEHCGLPVPPKRIIATGGASSNPSILKIMASIFGCPVYTSQRSGMHSPYRNYTDVPACILIFWSQYPFLL